MECIEIIKDKSKLEHTCYIELSLGKYRGKHWEETSLFFSEEVFGLIETIFESYVPGYCHYSMNDVDAETWQKIVFQLKDLSDLLRSSVEFDDIEGKVNFIFDRTRNFFYENFSACRAQLIDTIDELVAWVEENLEQYEYIAVLGL